MRYLYWNPDTPKPETLPQGCEFLVQTHIGSHWSCETYGPATWTDRTRRWPVEDHVYFAHHYCLAFGISIPQGYEVTGFRIATCHDPYHLTIYGRVEPQDSGFSVPILRRIEPKKVYKTPTDEDAKLRPTVEVRVVHNDEEYWQQKTLLAVTAGNFPFVTQCEDGGIETWSKCRMEVKP